MSVLALARSTGGRGYTGTGHPEQDCTSGRRRAAGATLLALPFLLVVLLTDHLTVGVVSFHSTDEQIYHLPVIRQFARTWPAPHWADYDSATGPLYHWLLAGWSRLVGPDVWKLRALNVLVSWASAVGFASALRRAGASEPFAYLGAAALALSPYVLGISFLVLTDNFALLLTVGFVLGLQEVRRRSLVGCATAATSLALLCLVRQPSAWLVVPFVAFGWSGTPTLRRLLGRAALAASALIPLGVMVVIWHGLLPPQLRSEHQGGLAVRNTLFGLAVAGALTPLLLVHLRGRMAADRVRTTWTAAAGAAAGLLGLLAVPLHPEHQDDGWLWRLAQHSPLVLGSSAVFLVLVPLAGAVVAVLCADARTRPAMACLAVFLVSLAANQTDYQKYSEPILLAGALLLAAGSGSAAGSPRRQPLAWLPVVGAALVGAAYFILQAQSVLL